MSIQTSPRVLIMCSGDRIVDSCKLYNNDNFLFSIKTWKQRNQRLQINWVKISLKNACYLKVR